MSTAIIHVLRERLYSKLLFDVLIVKVRLPAAEISAFKLHVSACNCLLLRLTLSTMKFFKRD